MTDALTRASARLESWMREAALPFWAGVQDETGAWPEHLYRDARPDRNAVRRHRVQARQVFTYAFATRLGWYDGVEIVRSTVDFMWEAGWSPDDESGFIHRLNPDGSVASGLRDLYDHAFYLLALGWAQETVGGQEARIANTLAFIDGLAHPAGGYREGVAATLPTTLARRQNPHMHLFEAALSLHAMSGEAHWMARARRLHALFEAHIFDPRHKCIREYFDEGWHWDGGTLEPGHACEWVWLLREYEKATGTDTRAHRDALYQNALLSGGIWLWDETTHDFEAVRETSRLWVQTELVKAHLAQSEDGVAGARDMAAAAIDGLLDIWLEPRGTWIDQIGACGQTLATTTPTSTFYHIILMASEAARVSKT